ncbi:MAG: hypothetical protein WA954_09360 [Parerythrobacter sp.]
MKGLNVKGLLLSLSLLAVSSPAEAKEIDTRTATNQKTPIAVEVGAGHTIDFSKTGEQVFRGWIGDGGRCLQLSPSSPLENGASIIYLRRITPCQQVTGLPVVGETTLTLATLSPAGESNIYEFSIDYGATGESLTRLIPSEVPPVASVAASRPQVLLLDPSAVKAGLETFDLDPDSPVALRVAAWLAAVEGGQGQRLAAQTAEVDWALLNRLAELGRNSLVKEGVLST